MKIPVYQPDLSGNEQKYVLECLESTWISSKGKFIEKFEEGFSRFVGAPHGAAVSNGTVALHLALLALGVGPGDEVIVPTFTYVASANAIRYVGATPVFVDSLRDTWQIDPEDVARRITERTKAILAVHLYGGACDMHRLRQICDYHQLLLVEDCAEAIGTTIGGRHVGTWGDVATFSFFGNKTITTGEGGMVLSNSAEVDQRVRLFRGQGLSLGREYWHEVVGYNYRMTNICAAIGVAQLERIDEILAAKRRLAQTYRDLLGNAVGFQASMADEVASHWMVTILVESERVRSAVRNSLNEIGVETRPAFHMVHTMPMYYQAPLDFPVAERLSSCGVNLPSWHKLEQSSLEVICHSILESLKNADWLH